MVDATLTDDQAQWRSQITGAAGVRFTEFTRYHFLVGLVGFTAASALCGFAPSPTVLVAARIAQGAFAAVMVPQVLSVISASFPPGDRAKAYGMFGATAGIATVLGPLLSGLLIKIDLLGLGWRPIFLINLPLGLAAIVTARAFVRESRIENPPRLDLAGAGLMTVALVLLLFPLVEGRQLGWPAWTFAAMAASIPTLGLFAVHQCRRERRGASPLVPPALFGQRAFTGGMLATLAFFSGPCALLRDDVHPPSPRLLAAAHRADLRAPLARQRPGSGRIRRARPAVGSPSHPGRRTPRPLGTGGLLLAVQLAGAELTTWTLLPGLIITGLGLGLVAPTLIDVVLTGVDPRDAGTASGALNTALQLGAAIGVTLIGVIFFGALPDGAAQAADPGPGYADAMTSALWYAAGIAILSALAMLLLPKTRPTDETAA